MLQHQLWKLPISFPIITVCLFTCPLLIIRIQPENFKPHFLDVGSLLLGQKKRNRKYLARLLKLGSYRQCTQGLVKLCISVAWLAFFFGHNNQAVKLWALKGIKNHHRRSFISFHMVLWMSKHLLPFNLVHVKPSGRTTGVNFINGMPVLSM